MSFKNVFIVCCLLTMTNPIRNILILLLINLTSIQSFALTRVNPGFSTIRQNELSYWKTQFFSSSEDLNSDDVSIKVEMDRSSNVSSNTDEPSKLKKVWIRMFPPKKDDDGLTIGQKLAKMGMSVLLSYGFVSNMSYSITVSLAWYIFSKRTGVSPLAPGQWPKFLAVYAGFYVFNNIVRPLRITLSVYVSTFFDNMVKAAQKRLKCSKGLAIGAIVFFFNIVGTIAAMSAGITLASAASGVPIWAK